jgi:hypothetical protein
MSSLCKPTYNNLYNYISNTPFYKIDTGVVLQNRDELAIRRINTDVRINPEFKPKEDIVVSTTNTTSTNNQSVGNSGGLRAGGYTPLIANSVGNSSSTSAITQLGTIRPMVDSIKLQKQGELGTTNKCTVTFVVSTIGNDMAELQKCYFIPGMTVRVEWGYYKDSTKTPYPISLPDTTPSSDATTQIREYIKQNKGLYCGLQGKVTNFSWTLESAKYWICTLEVISEAETAMEKSTIEPCKNNDGTVGPSIGIKITDEENKESVRIASPLLTSLMQVASIRSGRGVGEGWKVDLEANKAQLRQQQAQAITRDGMQSYGLGATVQKSEAAVASLDDAKKDTRFDPKHMFLETHQYEGPSREDSGKEGSGVVAFFKNLFTQTFGAGTNEAFISFAFLEYLITKHVLDEGKEGGKGSYLSSKNIYLPAVSNKEGQLIQQSVDPRVCIIPGTSYSKYLFDEDASYEYYKDKSAIRKGKDGRLYVQLSLIRLNVMSLAAILTEIEDPKNGDFKINTFMDRVLSSLSAATGNYWELIMTAMPDDPLTPTNESLHLIVTDIKGHRGTSSSPVPKAYSIPSNTKNSILADLKLDMKMTSAMRTQALYGKTSSTKTGETTTDKNPCAGKSARAWSLQGNADAIDVSVKPRELKPCSPDKSSPAAKAEPFSDKVTTWKDAMEALQDGITDSRVSAAREFQIKEVASALGEDKNACEGVPLPVECTMTFNFGVGGLGFGQLITCDFIPENVRNTFNWQITSVEHNLSGEGWTMQVHTVPRVKPKE